MTKHYPKRTTILTAEVRAHVTLQRQTVFIVRRGVYRIVPYCLDDEAIPNVITVVNPDGSHAYDSHRRPCQYR